MLSLKVTLRVEMVSVPCDVIVTHSSIPTMALIVVNWTGHLTGGNTVQNHDRSSKALGSDLEAQTNSEAYFAIPIAQPNPMDIKAPGHTEEHLNQICQ